MRRERVLKGKGVGGGYFEGGSGVKSLITHMSGSEPFSARPYYDENHAGDVDGDHNVQVNRSPGSVDDRWIVSDRALMTRQSPYKGLDNVAKSRAQGRGGGNQKIASGDWAGRMSNRV